jgi:hypothetical protein
MLRKLLQTVHPSEFFWFAPFLCIGLMAFSLLRPLPGFPAPAPSRIVVDAQGVKVPIAEPFLGIMPIAQGARVGDYLSNTRAPDTVYHAGGPGDRGWFEHDLVSKVYPDVLREDHYWDLIKGRWADRQRSEIEYLMTYHAGAYLSGGRNCCGTASLLRRIGFPVLYESHTNDWYEIDSSRAIVENALLGNPDRANTLIARYKQGFAEIESELQPGTLKYYPRVAEIGTSLTNLRYINEMSVTSGGQIYFAPAGMVNVSTRRVGGEDAERVLTSDPDIILLMAWRLFWPSHYESPQEFMHDPRWQGLKAVRERRVYHVPGYGGPGGMILRPIYERWLAELAHPERMKPLVRHLLRERFLSEFNYRLTDDQIDDVLNIEENRGSAGDERFEKNYQANNEHGSTK